VRLQFKQAKLRPTYCPAVSCQLLVSVYQILGSDVFFLCRSRRSASREIRSKKETKEPTCLKIRQSGPLLPESIVTGPGNTLRNVVVFVSIGAPPSNAT
jgi:hypothetical protein